MESKKMREELKSLKKKLLLEEDENINYSQAYQKLFLLDWISRLNVREIKMELEEVYIEDFKEELKQQEKIWSEVMNWKKLIEKRIALTGRSHVVDNKIMEGSSFIYYLDLPGSLVRTKILQYLTSPQDKMNLLEAVPGEAQVVPWSKSDLKFELDFLCQLEWGDISWETSSFKPQFTTGHTFLSFRQLSETNNYHKAVILREFENYLTNTRSSFRCSLSSESTVKLGQLETYWSPEELSLDLEKWLQFPETRILEIHFEDDIRHMDILRLRGNAIWDAFLFMSTDDIEDWHEFWNTFSHYLELMPNLRSLHLYFRNEEIDCPSGIQLPGLPYLKSLCIEGHPPFTQFGHSILEKYGPQVTQLVLKSSCEAESFPLDWSPCETLNVLTFEEQVVYRPYGIIFAPTPCGSLQVALRQDTQSPQSDIDLINLTFRRLTYFHTNLDPMPDGIDFVIAFPVLKTLYMTNWTRIEFMDEIWADREDVLNSKLWILLTKLEVAHLCDDCSSGKVTREDVKSHLARVILTKIWDWDAKKQFWSRNSQAGL